MPLPCSLLVDRDGRIAVIYRGVVSVDELLADVAQLSLSEADWSRTALPFPGRRVNVIPLYRGPFMFFLA